MVRDLILVKAILICFLVTISLSHVSHAIADEPSNLKDVFGQDWGLALIVGSEKACPHISENKKSSDPKTRRILITNDSVTVFDERDCVGVCDFREINTLLAECNAAEVIDGCIIYGALYEERFYSTSIDAAGKKLDDVCRSNN